MSKQKLLLGVALCTLTPWFAAQADEPIIMPEVLSKGQAEIPQKVILVFEDEKIFPIADNGELLKNLPGVSGSRLGGHGIEPFIRGQKQSQINLVDDGAYVLSACPNRMDPPSSYLQLEGNDKLIVEKGYTSVANGSGGSGGSVRTERSAPVFDGDSQSLMSVSGGYNSNGNMRDFAANTAVGFNEADYIRANILWKKANDYEDGDGKTVRSGFNNRGARIDLGMTPKIGTDLKFGLQYDKATDILFAGSGMDTPETTNKTARVGLTQNLNSDLFNTVKASAYMSGVEHLMDSYSLRTASMDMATDVDTRSYGGKLSLNGKKAQNEYVVGFDTKVGNSDALNYMGTTLDDTAIMSYIWPDLTMKEIGVYGENTFKLTQKSRLKVGARYDYVKVTAGKENEASSHGMSGNRTANDLYLEAYGYGWSDQTEHNLSGLARYEYDIDDEVTLYGSLSRSVRTADATERGVAKNTSGAMAASRWYGNPNIDPEQHHQIEFGSTVTKKNWSLGGSVYYNKVSDYILRDNARGQDGVLLANKADIYRNVDATLAGFEVSGGVDLSDNLSFSTNIAYTYGHNEEDNRALAQISPLEMSASLEYETIDWMSGIRMRAAAKQNRADVETNNNSGLDVEKTSGFAVFDVYGSVWAFEPAEITMGISNIFDKTYANHLNRGSSFDNTVSKVNEPGRSFFVRLNASF